MTRTPYPRGDRNPPARSDRDLLARISRSAGSKAGYKQLVRELGLGGGRERRLLVEQLTRMVARGELVRAGDDMWSIPKREPLANQPLAHPPAREDRRGFGTGWRPLYAEAASGW